jgi:large subunit ribosomal protein L25
MKKIEINSFIRKEVGKSACKKYRKEGLIPAVVYGKEESIPILIKKQEFEKILKKGESGIISLKIALDSKVKEKNVIIKEIQYHPVNNGIIHVDFQHVSLAEKIEVKTYLKIIGESPGVKKGGVIEQHIHELTIRCLPTKIPESISIDISKLDIGDSIHVKDISELYKEIEILENKEEVILTITPPTRIEEAPTPREVSEPEVIKEKGKTAEEEK